MRYAQAITRIRELIGQKARDNFEIGDIALDQFPIRPGDHTNTEAYAGLEMMARDADLSLASLRILRWVASRIPDAYP
jgi:hypothetical protein